RRKPEARTDPQKPDAGDERAGIEDAPGRPDPFAPSRQPTDRDGAEDQRGDDARNPIVEREQRGDRNRNGAGRDPFGEPVAPDEALPFPEHHNRREPPEDHKDKAADPRRRQREAPHRRGGGDAGLQIRPKASPPLARRRFGARVPVPHRHAPILTTPTSRPPLRRASRTAARAPRTDRAPRERPRRRNRATEWAGTRVPRRPPARAGSSTAA